MYQQQVEPEHGYTTYIMRSLRSPPAQQVSKQLGKMEIERTNFEKITFLYHCIALQKVSKQLGKMEIKRKNFEKITFLHHCIAWEIQELQDGWSSKDLTSAVSFFCQFHATGGYWNRNTDIRFHGKSITNAKKMFSSQAGKTHSNFILRFLRSDPTVADQVMVMMMLLVEMRMVVM